MIEQLVAISGSVSSGKSTLCNLLEEKFRVHHLKTRDILMKRDDAQKLERKALQEFGEKLDERTGGSWVREGIDAQIRTLDGMASVDAVRIRAQIDELRKSYGSNRVVHVHLTAPENVLSQRYKNRPPRGIQELKSYKAVMANATESRIEELASIADIVVDTDRCTKKDVLTRVAARLHLYATGNCRSVDVIVGGQYGSEGKGHIASYLAPEYGLLVRVGGPNAGHTVFDEPSPAKFHHLPSGTRHSNARLLLGPGAVINAERLMDEVSQDDVSATRLSIDPQAMIIQDEDVRAERGRGGIVSRIGSTGQGVGAALARKIRERKPGKVELARDTALLKPFIRPAQEVLEEAFRADKKVLLEGTQGTGLSLHHGTYPFVTSRDTTVSGCLAEAGISPSRVRRIVLVCRTYPIRVESPAGATSGPMQQEIDWAVVAKRSGLAKKKLLKAEKTTTTERQRRVGEFEWASLREAVALNGPTDIALTFADYIHMDNSRARRFEQLNEDTIRFIEEMEAVAGAPVSLVSTRFDWRSIIDRRSW